MQIRFLLLSLFLLGQKTITCKKIGNADLKMTVYEPPGLDANKQYKAIVFFFGGGWNKGCATQFPLVVGSGNSTDKRL